MSMKTFALAFQINAAFNGNKAFTDAAVRMRSLNSDVKRYAVEMKTARKSLAKTQNLDEFIKKQQEIGAKYTEIYNKQQKYGRLLKAQGNFEGSFSNMGKYAANAYQFAEMAKGIMSVADASVEFQQKLSKVQAITAGSTADMQKLKATAIELGEKTKFSASEAADAMSYLGMAGWKTNQIIEGMPGLLNLAAASGTDLATTADIISDDLTAFNMAASEAGHMADVMAAASTNANTNVEMMGATFKYAGAVAGSLGYKLEDVAIATGLMANAGIKAEQAGTSLRSIMTRLVKPPKAAAASLDSLGVSVTDSNGKMKPLAQTMQELRTKLSGLSEAEKASHAANIAGQEAMSGFLSIINASDEDFNKLSYAINHASDEIDGFNGAAEKMAVTMNDNAQGKMIAFKSAVSSLKIAVGDALLPTLTNATDIALSLSRSFASIAKECPGLIGGLGVTALAVTTLGAAGNGLMWTYNGLKSIYHGYNAVKAQTIILLEGEKYANIKAAMAGKAHTTSLWLNTHAHWAWIVGAKAATLAQGAWSMGAKSMTAAQWLLNASILGCPLTWLIGAIVATVAAAYLLYKNWDFVCNNVVYRIGYLVGWFQTIPERITEAFNSIDGGTFVEKAKNWGKLAVDGIVYWFTGLPARIGDIFAKIGNRFSLAFYAGQETAKAEVQHNATGGIYSKGAFLTTFAEESGESAIPHTPNAKNIGLLAKTNQIMGNPLGIGSGVNVYPQINVPIPNANIQIMLPERDKKHGASSNTVFSPVFSPNIQPAAVNIQQKQALPPIATILEKLKPREQGRDAVSNGEINATFAPNITIQGNADEKKLRQVLDDEMAKFRRMLEELKSQQRRVSYA